MDICTQTVSGNPEEVLFDVESVGDITYLSDRLTNGNRRAENLENVREARAFRLASLGGFIGPALEAKARGKAVSLGGG